MQTFNFGVDVIPQSFNEKTPHRAAEFRSTDRQLQLPQTQAVVAFRCLLSASLQFHETVQAFDRLTGSAVHEESANHLLDLTFAGRHCFR